MNSCQIQSLTLLLPTDAPYFLKLARTGSRKHPLSLAERLQLTLTDYQLGWNIARTFAEAKLPLPDFPWATPVLRAYRFCSEPSFCDDALKWAYELQQPQCWQVRDVIRALLLSTDSTYQSVSQSVQLPPEVIADFETLWWNVRDRRGDLLYLAQLLDGKHSELARKLMRVACLTNNSNLVLLAAGHRTALSDEVLVQLIEQLLVTEAELGQQLGLMSKKDNPALALLEQYLLSSQKPVEQLNPLTHVSWNKAQLAVIQQMTQQHMNEILETSQQLDLERRNESGAKSTGTPNDGAEIAP